MSAAHIRNAEIGDISSILALYAHHVENSLGTFEEIAPTPFRTGCFLPASVATTNVSAARKAIEQSPFVGLQEPPVGPNPQGPTGGSASSRYQVTLSRPNAASRTESEPKLVCM